MNYSQKIAPKNLLRARLIRPAKALGQNFLADSDIARKMVKLADVSSQDTILEVGPGTGALTKEIAKKAREVIAVEKDPRMVGLLKETFRESPNIKIINADILKIALSNISSLTSSYKVVANLPFHIVSPTIRKFLDSKFPPKEMFLIAQKEVAQRIVSKPPKMNLLALSVQFYAKAEIISHISRKSFFPSPKVDAAIIKITPRKQKNKVSAALFFKVAKAGFSHPRKQIINNFSEKLELDKNRVSFCLKNSGVSPAQRAQTLRLDDWVVLSKIFFGIVD